MKRIFAISLTIVIAFLFYFFHKMLPEIYFSMGQKAYNQKDYANAFINLNKSISLNSSNKEARYYYAQTLIRLKPSLIVQKELFKLSQADIADSAGLIAEQKIAQWKEQILSNSGENYIEQVPFNDQILRWDASKFPINVCIDNTSQAAVPNYYYTKIQEAFQKWQNETDNFIRFKFINSPQNAQILVKITSADEKSKCKEEGCKYVVAYTAPRLKNNLLKRMEISFYDSDNLSKPFSEKEIYNTALHEIGHALGIMGHSYNRGDLMYMEENEQSNQVQESTSDYILISQNDLNTLNLLYKLVPDITNTKLSEFDTSRQFFAPIVMGSEKEINSRKIQEAQNYINSAPNLPNGYIDLSSAYSELNQYDKAIEALNKALERATNDDEKYIIYYNFAIIYMNIKNWEKSLKFAQMAKVIKPSSDVDELIAGINSNKANQQNILKKFLH